MLPYGGDTFRETDRSILLLPRMCERVKSTFPYVPPATFDNSLENWCRGAKLLCLFRSQYVANSGCFMKESSRNLPPFGCQWYILVAVCIGRQLHAKFWLYKVTFLGWQPTGDWSPIIRTVNARNTDFTMPHLQLNCFIHKKNIS